MESIIVGRLTFEKQSDGHYLCRVRDFIFKVVEEPAHGWLLTMQNANVGYAERLYGLSPEDVRVALRLICGRARLDSDGLLRTVRDVWGSLKSIELP